MADKLFESIADGWGVAPAIRGTHHQWYVCFGDTHRYAVNGTYRNRRRAKKEITHYIMQGMPWCAHGFRKRIAQAAKQ